MLNQAISGIAQLQQQAKRAKKSLLQNFSKERGEESSSKNNLSSSLAPDTSQDRSQTFKNNAYLQLGMNNIGRNSPQNQGLRNFDFNYSPSKNHFGQQPNSIFKPSYLASSGLSNHKYSNSYS